MKISVKVHAKSKQAKVVQIDATHFEIWVRSAPEKGEANQAVIETMSAHLGVTKSRLSLAAGQTSKNKIIEIRK